MALGRDLDQAMSCVRTASIYHRTMNFPIAITAAALTALQGSATADIRSGHYRCVLRGQGICVEGGICLGNRRSPADGNILLDVDFGRRKALLDDMVGIIDVQAGKAPVIHWYLSIIGNMSVSIGTDDAETVITLGAERGFGATADFGCRPIPD